VRVLGPNEIDALAGIISKDELRTIFDVCLWSGMRYVGFRGSMSIQNGGYQVEELYTYQKTAQKKVKRKQLERYVHPVPQLLESELRHFFKGRKPPALQTWNENLNRWATRAGIDPTGISAKTTRKTIESWMVAAGVPLNVICLRQGHDSMTSMNHYQGLPFTESEKIEIQKRLVGWV
jgi:hypothetical protein